eukprot:IDg21302t1
MSSISMPPVSFFVHTVRIHAVHIHAVHVYAERIHAVRLNVVSIPVVCICAARIYAVRIYTVRIYAVRIHAVLMYVEDRFVLPRARRSTSSRKHAVQTPPSDLYLSMHETGHCTHVEFDNCCRFAPARLLQRACHSAHAGARVRRAPASRASGRVAEPVPVHGARGRAWCMTAAVHDSAATEGDDGCASYLHH